jgi:hypothetical protein
MMRRGGHRHCRGTIALGPIGTFGWMSWVRVSYFASWVARGHASWGSRVKIVGERGAIYFSSQGSPVALLGEPEVRREGVHEEPLPAATLEHGRFRHTLNGIGAVIQEGRPPRQ